LVLQLAEVGLHGQHVATDLPAQGTTGFMLKIVPHVAVGVQRLQGDQSQ